MTKGTHCLDRPTGHIFQAVSVAKEIGMTFDTILQYLPLRQYQQINDITISELSFNYDERGRIQHRTKTIFSTCNYP